MLGPDHKSEPNGNSIVVVGEMPNSQHFYAHLIDVEVRAGQTTKVVKVIAKCSSGKRNFKISKYGRVIE